jgi:hypothetical protein
MSEPTKVQRAHGAIRDMVKWAHDVEARSQIAHAAVDEAVREAEDCANQSKADMWREAARMANQHSGMGAMVLECVNRALVFEERLALRKRVTDG